MKGAGMSEQESRRKRMKKFITLSAAAVFVTVILVFLINLASAVSEVKGQRTGSAQAQNVTAVQSAPVEPAKSSTQSTVTGWGFLAAALSTGFGCLGAGIAVAYVGSAALGVIGEKPELTGRALIYVGLAEGIAIYGLIIAIMILTRI
jgi:F0F1-type ATP synthase membrane subunit c/vacuolar-type H+-ATPase subunit K